MDIGIPMYNNSVRTTLDGEWDEDELVGDVLDECMKILPGMTARYTNRAMIDRDMMLPQYMASHICEENDLIEIYNREYDKHRNDGKFGITYFDEWLSKEITRLVNANLVGGKR